MKRMIAMITLMFALVLFSACAAAVPTEEPRLLSLPYRDVTLSVGMAADEAVLALGDDYTMTEVDSCAGQGKDRMYTYPSVRLYVFAPTDGKAVVSSVSYTDDGVQTAQGLRIGSSSSDVLAALGEADDASDTRLVYRSENTTLTFGLRDGMVVSIVLAGE